MTDERKMEDTVVVTEPDCPMLTVMSGNTTLRIGLHFSKKEKKSVDDIFHRLITDKVKQEQFK